MSWAAPVVTTKTNADFSSAGGTVTFSHASGSGNNRLLLLMAAYADAGASDHDITGVTFNGVALSSFAAKLQNENTGALAWGQAWYLKMPDAVTANIVVTYSTGSATRSVVLAALTYVDVDQTTPYSGYTTNTGSSTNSSVTVASAAGQLVVAMFFQSSTNLNAPGDTETELADINRNVSNNIGMAVQSDAGAASVVMNNTSTGSVHWGAIGFSLHPASAATAMPVIHIHQQQMRAS